jgi:hypothetical protein
LGLLLIEHCRRKWPVGSGRLARRESSSGSASAVFLKVDNAGSSRINFLDELDVCHWSSIYWFVGFLLCFLFVSWAKLKPLHIAILSLK